MEDYRPVMISITHLVALWAIAYISAPLTPNSMVEYAMLALASVWMLFAMVHVQKTARMRMTSLFFGAVALIPWFFYGELWYISNNNDEIAPDVFEANLRHAVFVYHSFKYMFLGCAVLAALRCLFIAVKNFGSTEPY